MPSRAAPASPALALAAPADDSWLALDRQLCFALYSASLAMTKLYTPLLTPLGLTYPQYLVMLALWEDDAVTVSALGQRLHLDSGTLTPLLKRLETSGLLSRRRDTEDERRVRVQLSPAGRQLKRKARLIPPAVVCATQCDLHDISELTQRLTALRQQLHQAAA
jgi:MarR family transcriptional regulator, organic hydroperoxide resistance regulator